MEKRPLRPEQQRAIEALVSGATRRIAAKSAGVDERTVYTWLATDQNFADAYTTACDQVHRYNVAAVQKAQTAATDRLVKALKSKNEGNAIRAAIALTDSGFKAAEQFLFDRRLRKAEERASNTGEPTPGDRIDRQPEHDAGTAEPGSGVLPGETG